MDLTEKKPEKMDIKKISDLVFRKEITINLRMKFLKLLLSVFILATLLLTIGFGVGRFYYPYFPPKAVLPKSVYMGTLYKSSAERFYIVTSTLETYTLDVPKDFDLSKFIGQKVTISAGLNINTKLLEVTDPSDIEISKGI